MSRAWHRVGPAGPHRPGKEAKVKQDCDFPIYFYDPSLPILGLSVHFKIYLLCVHIHVEVRV